MLSKLNSILQKFILERRSNNTDVTMGTLTSGQGARVNRVWTSIYFGWSL